MLIWLVMAILLVVLVAGGYVGRRRAVTRSGSKVQAHSANHSHHGKDAHGHLGRGSH